MFQFERFLPHPLTNFLVQKMGALILLRSILKGMGGGAIHGGSRIISQQLPKMMIEIQASRHEIFEFLTDKGYVLFGDSPQLKMTPADLNGNIFCLHREKRSSLIHKLGILEIDS